MINKLLVSAYGIFSLCVGMFVGSTILDEKPTPEMVCPYGATEDSCVADYVEEGKWRLIPNEG